VVDGDALPRLGGGKNRVSDIALSFAAPRDFCHGPIEAAGAARGANASKSRGDFPVRSQRLEVGERRVAKAVMSPHQLSLIVGSRNVVLIFLGEGRRWIEAKGIALDGKRVQTVQARRRR
jgi:hypothetical protein